MGSGRPYTAEESALISTHFNRGDGARTIARLLPGRSPGSIYNHMQTLGLYRVKEAPPRLDDRRPFRYDPEQAALRGDAAFKKAMLAAINSGGEHAEIGVMKNKRPMLPAHFDRSPSLSGCGSSAALCVDMGVQPVRHPSGLTRDF